VREPGWPKWPSGVDASGITAIAVDDSKPGLEIHVIQRNLAFPPVYTFNEDGFLLRTWGVGAIDSAHGIRVQHYAGSTYVWVADFGDGAVGHTVKRFSTNGTVLNVLGTAGHSGTGINPFQFDQVADIAFDSEGNAYVSDGDAGINDRVSKWSQPDYKFEWTIGSAGSGPGQFDSPHSIGVDHLDRIWVADRGNNRTQTFNTAGQFIGQYPSACFDEGDAWGVGIWKSRAQMVVTDGLHQRFYLLDIDGEVSPEHCTLEWSASTQQPGTTHLVDIDQRNGNAYIAVVGPVGQTSANKFVFQP